MDQVNQTDEIVSSDQILQSIPDQLVGHDDLLPPHRSSSSCSTTSSSSVTTSSSSIPIKQEAQLQKLEDIKQDSTNVSPINDYVVIKNDAINGIDECQATNALALNNNNENINASATQNNENINGKFFGFKYISILIKCVFLVDFRERSIKNGDDNKLFFSLSFHFFFISFICTCISRECIN